MAENLKTLLSSIVASLTKGSVRTVCSYGLFTTQLANIRCVSGAANPANFSRIGPDRASSEEVNTGLAASLDIFTSAKN